MFSGFTKRGCLEIFLTAVCYFIPFANGISLSLAANEKEMVGLKKMKYHLSICAVFKNEAKFLKEWIEYHLLVGVDHFYLYNLSSTDIYMSVLRPYIMKNIVTLVQWPNYPKELKKNDLASWMLGIKLPAYENAAKYRALNETEWMVFVDVDEFLVPPSHLQLPEILEKYRDAPGIILESNCYSTSKLFPTEKLIIESEVLSDPPEVEREKTIVKTIFKPKCAKVFLWPPFSYVFRDDKSPVKLNKHELHIKHYLDRNPHYLNLKKSKELLHVDSRLLTEEEKNELLKNYEIEDREGAMKRFIPEVRKRLGISP